MSTVCCAEQRRNAVIIGEHLAPGRLTTKGDNLTITKPPIGALEKRTPIGTARSRTFSEPRTTGSVAPTTWKRSSEH
uniref:FAA_hydrolase domain-containing protein n=1 Tax=Steinernema glaseri TaxID=37863 RepID=A0A1I7YQZ0_9BILA